MGKAPLSGYKSQKWSSLLRLKTLPLVQKLAGRFTILGYVAQGTAGTCLTAVSLDTAWDEWEADGHMCCFGLKASNGHKPSQCCPKKGRNGVETIDNRFRPRMRADLVEVYRNGPRDKAPNN